MGIWMSLLGATEEGYDEEGEKKRKSKLENK